MLYYYTNFILIIKAQFIYLSEKRYHSSLFNYILAAKQVPK